MTYIVEVVGIIAGIVYMIMGITKYGVWEGISISGGFMPLWGCLAHVLWSVFYG